MLRKIIRAVTPTCLTTDVTVGEHLRMLRAVGYPVWYAWVPGWMVEWHSNRKGFLCRLVTRVSKNAAMDRTNGIRVVEMPRPNCNHTPIWYLFVLGVWFVFITWIAFNFR